MIFFRSILLWFTIILILYVVYLLNDLKHYFWIYTSFWDTLYQQLGSVLVGLIASFFMYFLVVYIPDKHKKTVIKNNSLRIYRMCKHNIILIVLQASWHGGRTDIDMSMEEIEKLKNPEYFLKHFHANGESNQGFNAFRNHMSQDVPEYRDILIELHTIGKQLEYILNHYKIEDEQVLGLFTRIEAQIIRIEQRGAGYEEEKGLSNLLLQMLGGFSFIEGPLGYDIFERMLEDL